MHWQFFTVLYTLCTVCIKKQPFVRICVFQSWLLVFKHWLVNIFFNNCWFVYSVSCGCWLFQLNPNCHRFRKQALWTVWSVYSECIWWYDALLHSNLRLNLIYISRVLKTKIHSCCRDLSSAQNLTPDAKVMTKHYHTCLKAAIENRAFGLLTRSKRTGKECTLSSSLTGVRGDGATLEFASCNTCRLDKTLQTARKISIQVV